jgi:cytochrome c oxidase subunit IV
MSEHAQHPTPRVYYTVFAALLVLLVATVLVAEVELGRLNLLVAAAIATSKAVLIILFFMHVRYSAPLTWLVAGASFFWLMILFGLTMNDYWTRGMLREDHQPPAVRAEQATPFTH